MNALKIVTFFFFIVAATTLAQNNTKCPFQFLYHFGDGISDIGNAVRVLPFGPSLPAARFPYGVTYPGRPTGRWSDGFVDVDYVAQGVGLPNIKPYLNLGFSRSHDGVIFSVAGSTTLSTSFFNSKGVRVPPYNIPLAAQFNWFRSYLRSTCTNQQECEKRTLPNSVVLFESGELNDIGYALVQGRTIQQVTTYIPLIVQAQIDAAREAIKLGATRIVYTTAAPLGCYPYILTALSSNETTDYDALGCLKAVDSLAVSFNVALQTAFTALKLQFPLANILGADFYTAAKTFIFGASSFVLDPSGNPALKSCCGIGGKYNFDITRLCGRPNVPVCPNPKTSIYWDGLHFTQETYRRIINTLLPPALLLFGCRLI